MLRAPVAGLLAAMLLFGALLLPAAAEEATDLIGVPGPIVHEGTSYALAWSAKPSENYYKQEYLPAGQEPESFSQMMLVEVVAGEIAVMDAVKAQTDLLTARKGSDPVVNFDIIQNEATGEVILDFVMSAADEAGQGIIEWNAYRYAPLAGEGGNKGVLLFGTSRRAYGDDNAKAFLGTLGALRQSAIPALGQAEMPKPVLAE